MLILVSFVLIHYLKQRLINQGQNVNQKHQLGWTPLHTAAFNGSER